MFFRWGCTTKKIGKSEAYLIHNKHLNPDLKSVNFFELWERKRVIVTFSGPEKVGTFTHPKKNQNIVIKMFLTSYITILCYGFGYIYITILCYNNLVL